MLLLPPPPQAHREDIFVEQERVGIQREGRLVRDEIRAQNPVLGDILKGQRMAR